MQNNMKKDTIQFPDFLKLDIRVGEVKHATTVEGSTKLVLLTVDLGPDYGENVEIFTGMLKWYQPEDFIGKKFMFLANLEPRPMMGKTSNGMLMSVEKDGAPVLSPVDASLPNGACVI
jgi:methionyl-tRNA synthetase